MTKGGEILPNLVTLGHLHRTSTKCSAQPYLYPWWSVQSSVTRFGENLFLWEKFTIFVINFEDLINVFQKNIVSTIFCPYATFNCCKCSCIKQAIFTFGHTGLSCSNPSETKERKRMMMTGYRKDRRSVWPDGEIILKYVTIYNNETDCIWRCICII